MRIECIKNLFEFCQVENLLKIFVFYLLQPGAYRDHDREKVFDAYSAFIETIYCPFFLLKGPCHHCLMAWRWCKKKKFCLLLLKNLSSNHNQFMYFLVMPRSIPDSYIEPYENGSWHGSRAVLKIIFLCSGLDRWD